MGRDEKRAPLKTPAWEATPFQDDAQVEDTRFIFVFALSNSADLEPGAGYSELGT